MKDCITEGHLPLPLWPARSKLKLSASRIAGEQALYEPLSFQFDRAPEPGDELDDFEYALRACAYRALQ